MHSNLQKILIFCCMLILSSAAMAGGEQFRDIPYATISKAQKLDMYVPEGNGPFPVVIWIHGGGWERWDKGLEPTDPQMSLLAHGYALVSVNYRLIGEAIFPAQIHDVKAALRWIRVHASEYRLDSARIGAWGASAGAHLAALLGTTNGVDDMQDPSLGNPFVSTKVQAVVDWYGPIDFMTMDQQLKENGFPRVPEKGHNSPTSCESRLVGGTITEHPERVLRVNPAFYITPDDPPFLFEHGTLDKSVPHQQSQMMFDSLKRVIGKEKVQIRFFAVGHGVLAHGDPFSSEENILFVINFLDRWLK
ncbi:MAG: alpha/beta hydrolase [Ignavibacteriales bacterium]|nr:alpha/beta hydrolase [Ignavibacteriales bacterium]